MNVCTCFLLVARVILLRLPSVQFFHDIGSYWINNFIYILVGEGCILWSRFYFGTQDVSESSPAVLRVIAQLGKVNYYAKFNFINQRQSFYSQIQRFKEVHSVVPQEQKIGTFCGPVFYFDISDASQSPHNNLRVIALIGQVRYYAMINFIYQSWSFLL